MSGNSKGAQAPTKSEDITAVQPAYLKNTRETQMPAAMPGQLSAIAQQLGVGFGIPPQAFGNALAQMYSSPRTLSYGMPPVAPKPAPKVDPKKDPTKPSDKFTYLGGRNNR